MSARTAGQAHATKIEPDRAVPSGWAVDRPRPRPDPAPPPAGASAPIASVVSASSRSRSSPSSSGSGSSPAPRFTASPTAYAHYLATGRYTWLEIATTIALGAVGVVAIVGLTLLLSASRARWVAIVGGATALAGAVCLMISVGTLVVRAPRVAGPLLRGRLDEVVINAQTRGTTTAVLVLVGAALLTIGWLLLGLAVFLTSGLSQGDGGLLELLGSADLPRWPVQHGAAHDRARSCSVPPVSASSARPVGWVRREDRSPLPSAHRAKRSPTSAFAFTDDMEGDELDGLDDEQIAAIYNDVEIAGDPSAEAEVAEESSDGVASDAAPAERRSAAARSSHGTPTAWSVTRSESGEATHGAPEPSTKAAKAPEPSPAAPNSGVPKTGTANRTADKTSGSIEEKASNAKRPSNDSRLNEAPTADVAAKPTTTARRGRFGRGKRPA